MNEGPVPLGHGHSHPGGDEPTLTRPQHERLRRAQIRTGVTRMGIGGELEIGVERAQRNLDVIHRLSVVAAPEPLSRYWSAGPRQAPRQTEERLAPGPPSAGPGVDSFRAAASACGRRVATNQ